MREQVDRNDFKIKQLEPLHARGNVVSCLLDAGCIEYRKEAGRCARALSQSFLIEVLNLVVVATGDTDMDMVIAALLHDVVEDTPTTYGDIAASFGERVAEIVRENSDNMSLPKSERRRARIATMSFKSREARIVKIADVISNLRAIAVSPPAGWSVERKLGYLEGCRQLVDAGRGTEASIERIFDETAADVERAQPGQSHCQDGAPPPRGRR